MSKIKTIRRRKAWPVEYRWYTVGPLCPFLGYTTKGPQVLFTRKPSIHLALQLWHCTRGVSYQVDGPRLSRDWTKTLRRIVP